MTTHNEGIANIQKTGLFTAIKALLAGAGLFAALSPTPWDNTAVLILQGVIDGLERATTGQEASRLVASVIDDSDTVLS
jgi:hypothetical protein